MIYNSAPDSVPDSPNNKIKKGDYGDYVII